MRPLREETSTREYIGTRARHLPREGRGAPRGRPSRGGGDALTEGRAGPVFRAEVRSRAMPVHGGGRQ